MVDWYEFWGERISPQQVGTVRLNTFCETRKKPLWLVSVKSLGALMMCAVGFAMFLPWLPLPTWQSAMLVSGVLLIYIGLAFFVRPEPHGENMGFLGGLVNDPTQYSDNVNRALWKVHCLLGPGRYISETILDCCTLLGVTAEVSEEQHQMDCAARESAALEADLQQLRQRVMERLAQRQSGQPQGQQELATSRLLDPERSAP